MKRPARLVALAVLFAAPASGGDFADVVPASAIAYVRVAGLQKLVDPLLEFAGWREPARIKILYERLTSQLFAGLGKKMKLSRERVEGVLRTLQSAHVALLGFQWRSTKWRRYPAAPILLMALETSDAAPAMDLLDKELAKLVKEKIACRDRSILAMGGRRSRYYLLRDGNRLILATDRKVMEQVVFDLEKPLPGRMRLSSLPGFRSARRARAGSTVWAYGGFGPFFDLLKGGFNFRNREDFDRADAIVDLRALHHLSVASWLPTAGKLGETVLDVALDGKNQVFRFLRGKNLDPSILKVVPRDAFMVLSVSFDDFGGRWKEIREFLVKADTAVFQGRGGFSRAFQWFARRYNVTMTQLFDQVDGDALLVGVHPRKAPAFVFRVKDPAKIGALIDRAKRGPRIARHLKNRLRTLRHKGHLVEYFERNYAAYSYALIGKYLVVSYDLGKQLTRFADAHEDDKTSFRSLLGPEQEKGLGNAVLLVNPTALSSIDNDLIPLRTIIKPGLALAASLSAGENSLRVRVNVSALAFVSALFVNFQEQRQLRLIASRCASNLTQLNRAIASFVAENKRPPKSLAELVPRHVKDPASLACPMAGVGGQQYVVFPRLFAAKRRLWNIIYGYCPNLAHGRVALRSGHASTLHPGSFDYYMKSTRKLLEQMDKAASKKKKGKEKK